MKKNVLIIGGGPAGMCAAVFAARAGADVTILEHGAEPGRKILSTGGGRCNLTNERLDAEAPETFYQSFSADRGICRPDPAGTSFVKRSFHIFGLREAEVFFESIGLVTVSKDGYLYPRSLNAASVRSLLKEACRTESVRIVTDTAVTSAEKRPGPDGAPLFVCNAGEHTFTGDSLILACGGIAAPATGSDGSGFRLADMLGHPCTDPMPALLPLQGDRKRYRALAGLRMQGKASLFIDGKYICSDAGELQFTEQFVSGIPVFNVSAAAVRALSEGHAVETVFDLLPELREKDLIRRLFSRGGSEKMTLFTAFLGMLPGKAVSHFLRMADLDRYADLPLSEAGEDAVRTMIRLLKDFRVAVTGYPGPDRAQCSTGGIPVRSLEPETMESVITPGLYFAGEMIDVTGICGGYNLQWAWTSGALAGKAAAL